MLSVAQRLKLSLALAQNFAPSARSNMGGLRTLNDYRLANKSAE